MSYGFEVYLPVEASIAPMSLDVPSGADTTSGYYISYDMAPAEEGGGFSGAGWFFGVSGNPLEAAGLKDYSSVEARFNANGGNLNDVFSNWLNNAGPNAVHSFCNHLWDNAGNCITMV